jgi:hypothetical protein
MNKDQRDVSHIDKGEIKEPFGNTEQLPIAWVYPEFMKNIKDAKCWTAYATYHEDRPIPLYTHPMRELSDKEIIEVYKKVIESYGHDFAYTYARAILKKASEK